MVRAHVGEKLSITFNDDPNTVRVDWEKPLERAQKFPIDEKTLREQLSRLGDTPYELANLRLDTAGEPMVPKSVLNDLHRAGWSSLWRSEHRFGRIESFNLTRSV